MKSRFSQIRAQTGQTDTQTDATEPITSPRSRVVIVIIIIIVKAEMMTVCVTVMYWLWRPTLDQQVAGSIVHCHPNHSGLVVHIHAHVCRQAYRFGCDHRRSAMLCGWKGGIALAMRHRHAGITYPRGHWLNRKMTCPPTPRRSMVPFTVDGGGHYDDYRIIYVL